MLCLTAVQACTFDTANLDELTCTREGQTDGERVCRDGYWVISDNADMLTSTHDMTGADPDFSSPPKDQGTPPADMPAPTPDMPADMAPTPDMPADMPDLPADMEPAPDMPVDMNIECPTQAPLLCEMLRQDRDDNKVCADLSNKAPITLSNGCVLPADLQCDCLQDDEVCTLDERGTGTCAPPMCIPESADDYCARVEAANPNTRVCGKGFAIPDNCGQRRPEVSCDFCQAEEACSAPSGPGQCVCVPLDPVQDFAALCQQQGDPCGDITIADGCGGQVTLSNCTTCSAAETCTPTNTPQPGQPAAICESLPVRPLPTPPNISSDARFGASLAAHGNWLAVGAPNEQVLNSDNNLVRCGAVHMYRLEQGSWVWKQRIADARAGICNNGSEEFGFAVDIMHDRLVIGAPGDGDAGRVHIYSYFNNQWMRRATFAPGQDISPASNQYSNDARIGHSVAVRYISQSAFRVGVGAPLTNFNNGRTNAGAIYLIDANFQNGSWDYDFDLAGSADIQGNANLGTAMTWRTDSRLWAGSPFYTRGNDTNTGAVDEFIYNSALDSVSSNGGPYDIDSLGISNQSNSDDAYYGYAMASDEATNWVCQGTPGKDNDQGRTYIMDRNFMLPHKVLSAPSPDNDDSFGIAVDITSNARLIVGAPGDDGPMNMANNTGAAFIYEQVGSNFNLMYEAHIPSLPVDARAGDAVAIHPNWAFFSASWTQGGEVYLVDLDALP